MVTVAPVSITAKVLITSTMVGISQQPEWLVVPILSSLTTSKSDDSVQVRSIFTSIVEREGL